MIVSVWAAYFSSLGCQDNFGCSTVVIVPLLGVLWYAGSKTLAAFFLSNAMNFLLILLRMPQYDWSHSMIIIITLDILFICFIIRVNNFHGFLVAFQELADYIAADQVSPLKRNNICLRYRASSSVLASSGAFVTTGPVYLTVSSLCSK